MEQIVGGFCAGEALVQVFVLIVDEVLVLLELVLLASQELVQLAQPGTVLSFSVLISNIVKTKEK